MMFAAWLVEPEASGVEKTCVDLPYLLRATLMSTWGFFPPFWTVFPGLGAGFLNLGAKTDGTAKKRGKTSNNGREMA